jgi:ribosome-associated heat shock protein Hsp15
VTFQRLDMFLWCARFASQRSACAAMVETGMVRINRQPTDKPHAKIRVGDVLTLPLRGGVRVVRVVALAERRGSAAAARGLYEDLEERRESAGEGVPPPVMRGTLSRDDPPSHI